MSEQWVTHIVSNESRKCNRIRELSKGWTCWGPFASLIFIECCRFTPQPISAVAFRIVQTVTRKSANQNAVVDKPAAWPPPFRSHFFPIYAPLWWPDITQWLGPFARFRHLWFCVSSYLVRHRLSTLSNQQIVYCIHGPRHYSIWIYSLYYYIHSKGPGTCLESKKFNCIPYGTEK